MGCHDPLQHDEFLIRFIFYFTMFGCYLLGVCAFLISNRKGVDPEKRRSGEELGRVGGDETIIKIYCMRKESILNIKYYYTRQLCVEHLIP